MNVESDKNFFSNLITTDLKYETNWMNKKIDDRLLDFEILSSLILISL